MRSIVDPVAAAAGLEYLAPQSCKIANNVLHERLDDNHYDADINKHWLAMSTRVHRGKTLEITIHCFAKQHFLQPAHKTLRPVEDAYHRAHFPTCKAQCSTNR